MKTKSLFLKTIALVLLTFNCFAQSGINKLPSWAFGGFVRPDGLNPIISPDKQSTFTDPVSKKIVYWEANDTFNPGAAIKDGKIVDSKTISAFAMLGWI